MDFLLKHILSIIVFLPLLFAIPCFWFSSRMAKKLALTGSLLNFILCLVLWVQFDPNSTALQFAESYAWLPDLGIQYIVGVDGLSILLVVLTGFLTPLTILSLFREDHHAQTSTKNLLPLMLILETGMLGSLVAIDLVFFYVFWEAMLIPMYFMIGIWGGARRIYATTKFVIYTVVGSLLMLVAAIGMYMMHFEEFGFYSTNLLDLYKLTISGGAQSWLFAAFALAFAIKVPIWPFHTWLPDAHVEAPTIGSVILAGVLLKLGTYGLLRFAIPLFPEATMWMAPIVVGLGVIGILYGALTAWVQDDAKKLVAYSSVSHLGFVVIGSFALVGNKLSIEALTGAVYQMINHGISTGALFFLVGFIYAQRHTRLLNQFGGLAGIVPWFSVALIIATLGSVGLPGTGGFVGEFYILIGVFQSSPITAITAALGVLLGALYMLKLCKAILFGPVTVEENRKLVDFKLLEFLYMGPLIILIIVMGIFPNLFLNKSKASIEYFAKNFTRYELSLSQFEGKSSSNNYEVPMESDD